MPFRSTGDRGCPTEELLLDFAAHALDEHQSRALEAHVHACGECFRMLAAYGRTCIQSRSAPPWSRSEAHADAEMVRRLQRGAALARGTVLGRYVLLDWVGEGAFGVVYTAYDPDLERKIAVKVLRTPDGALDPSLRDRLLREARAMARIAHPNVACAYDAGVQDSHVFVAMEYVEGATLRSWLRSDTRTVDDVVRTLLEAGRGLAAAHEAGLVHRDFKPENVLIGAGDRPRVTDFGLSCMSVEARGAAVGATSAHAASATIGGTPAYMAPEQKAGAAADARSDQYAFCVTLHEALYGARPGEEAPSAGASTASPRRVPAAVRAILERGLSPWPEERFSSMGELLVALERTGAKRRRIGAALALVGTAALGFVVAFSLRTSAVAPVAMCTHVEEHLAGVWDEGRKHTIMAAFRATGKPYAEDAWRGTEKRLDDYASAWSKVRVDACRATRVRGDQSDEVLALRTECLDRRLAELHALSDLFVEAAPDVVERAVSAAGALPPVAACSDVESLRVRVKLPDDPERRARVLSLESALEHARALKMAGRYPQALAEVKELVPKALDVSHKPLLAEALYLRGEEEEDVGSHDAAEASLLDAVSAAEASRHDELAAETWAMLVGIAGAKLHKSDDAKRYEARALAAIERNGGKGTAARLLLKNLARTLLEQGHFADAAQKNREALAMEERDLGKTHLDVADTLRDLGRSLREDGQLEPALDALQRGLAIQEAELGGDHPEVASTLHGLAIVYQHLGRYDDAIVHFRRALAIREGYLGPTHPDVAATISSLVMPLRWRGDFAEASLFAERALEITRDKYGDVNASVATTWNNVGFVATAREDFVRAEEAFTTALRIREKVLGPEHPLTSTSMCNLGLMELARGRAAQALAWLVRALALDEKKMPAEHPALSYALMGVGLAHLGLGHAAQALPLLERAHALRERFPMEARLRAQTRFALARALWDGCKDASRAVALARQADDVFAPAGKGFAKEHDEVRRWLEANTKAGAPRSRAGRCAVP